MKDMQKQNVKTLDLCPTENSIEICNVSLQFSVCMSLCVFVTDEGLLYVYQGKLVFLC